MYHLGISRAPSHGSSVIRGAKMPSPWRRRPSGSRCWGWPQRPPIPRSGGCTTGKTPWDFKPANIWKEYGFYYQLYIYIFYIFMKNYEDDCWMKLDLKEHHGTSYTVLLSNVVVSCGFSTRFIGFQWFAAGLGWWLGIAFLTYPSSCQNLRGSSETKPLNIIGLGFVGSWHPQKRGFHHPTCWAFHADVYAHVWWSSGPRLHLHVLRICLQL